MPSAVFETVPELLSLCVAKRRTRPTQKAKPSFRLAVEIYSIPIMPPKCNRTSVREKCNEVSFSHLAAGIVATVWASLAGLTFDNVAVFFRILGSRFWERKLLATGTDTCRFRRLLCFAGCDWFILTRASASLFFILFSASIRVMFRLRQLGMFAIGSVRFVILFCLFTISNTKRAVDHLLLPTPLCPAFCPPCSRFRFSLSVSHFFFGRARLR